MYLRIDILRESDYIVFIEIKEIIKILLKIRIPGFQRISVFKI